MASQSDFQATCDRLAEHLASDDAKAQAAGAVTVALMLQSEASAPFAPAADLSKLCKAFCDLLESNEAAIQASMHPCHCLCQPALLSCEHTVLPALSLDFAKL